jgi:hypothetical protein
MGKITGKGKKISQRKEKGKNHLLLPHPKD